MWKLYIRLPALHQPSCKSRNLSPTCPDNLVSLRKSSSLTADTKPRTQFHRNCSVPNLSESVTLLSPTPYCYGCPQENFLICHTSDRTTPNQNCLRLRTVPCCSSLCKDFCTGRMQEREGHAEHLPEWKVHCSVHTEQSEHTVQGQKQLKLVSLSNVLDHENTTKGCSFTGRELGQQSSLKFPPHLLISVILFTAQLHKGFYWHNKRWQSLA